MEQTQKAPASVSANGQESSVEARIAQLGIKRTVEIVDRPNTKTGEMEKSKRVMLEYESKDMYNARDVRAIGLPQGWRAELTIDSLNYQEGAVKTKAEDAEYTIGVGKPIGELKIKGVFYGAEEGYPERQFIDVVQGMQALLETTKFHVAGEGILDYKYKQKNRRGLYKEIEQFTVCNIGGATAFDGTDKPVGTVTQIYLHGATVVLEITRTNDINNLKRA